MSDPTCPGVAAGGAGLSPAGAHPAPRGLPCHLSEQLNPINKNTGGRAQRLKRLIVELEIQGLVIRHGVERIGFLTFTFADDVKTIAEAQRRFNSMNSNGLAGRYVEWVCVVQRHKDGRIHFHLVVVLKQDIRTGFDFAAVKRRDYSSASTYLKAEWSFLRALMPEYQFGRHELLPVRLTGGFGKYVARYVGRSEDTRQAEKGARLVRYSKGFVRTVCGPFSKSDKVEERARDRLPSIAFYLNLPSCADFGSPEHFESVFGGRWRYHMARIMYCSPFVFAPVLVHAQVSLSLYGGRLLALEEAFAAYEAKQDEPGDLNVAAEAWQVRFASLPSSSADVFVASVVTLKSAELAAAHATPVLP
jgi:hypothetical protein